MFIIPFDDDFTEDLRSGKQNLLILFGRHGLTTGDAYLDPIRNGATKFIRTVEKVLIMPFNQITEPIFRSAGLTRERCKTYCPWLAETSNMTLITFKGSGDDAS